MNIYNNLPYDIQFKIDGMLLKEHNDKNTSRVIAEINDRQTIINIYNGIVYNRPYFKKDCKMEWVFKEVMTWGLYGGKTITKRSEEYKSKFKRIFHPHSSINKHIKPLYDYIFNGKSFRNTIDFKNKVRVAITWYLKSQYKTIESIYRLLVDFNLNGIIDVMGVDDIQEIITAVSYNIYCHFIWTFDNVICEGDFDLFVDYVDYDDMENEFDDY